MKNTTTIFMKNWLALLLLAATTVVPWNLRAEVVYVTAPTVTIVSVTDTSVTLTVQQNYSTSGFPSSPFYNFTFSDAANHSTKVELTPGHFAGGTGTIRGLSPGTTYNMCLVINYGSKTENGISNIYESNTACQSFTTTVNGVYTGSTNTGGGSAVNTGSLPITTDSVSTCTAPRSILLTHIYGVTNYLIQADEFSSGKYVMDGSTDTVSFTNSSQPYYVNLLNGTLYHVYLHKACDINNQYWAHISSLTFFPDTIFLQATDVTDTSIIVSWDAGDAISANVKYVASGSTDTISFTTTMNTAMIYPLTPLTEYHIYVQAVYNDTVGYWEEITATTLEAQQNSGPLSLTLCDGTSINAYFPIYGFYMDASQHLQMIYPDSMLTALRGAEITQLTFYTSDQPSYSFDNIVTMSMAVTSSSQCGGSFVQESLETVSVDTVLIEDSMYVVTFDSPFTYPATGGNLLLDVDVQEGNSYQSIYFLGVNADGMSYMTYNSSTGGSSFLPKVTIDYELVTCAKPTDLMPVSVGATTATVAWTSGASQWNVKYVAAGQTDTVYQTVSSVNGITLSDLTPNQTTYYIYVQADCGATDGLSRWVFTSFTTECSEMPVPYNTNFEEFAEGVMPSCWDVNDPSATMAAVYQDGTMSHSGTQMLALSTEADTMVVLLPAFDSLSNLQLEFYAKTIEGYAIDSLEVGVMENNDFVPMASFVLGTSYQSDPYSVPFDTYAGTGGKMALRAFLPANMTQCGFVIDDVVVDTISDCTPVSNLITDNSTIGELQVSWNAGANETAWEVCYYYEGSDTTILQVSTPGLVITDVEFDTTYTVKVRANCGNNSYSNWRSAEVRSRCDYVMIPYEEDFENTELYTYPSCWEIQTNCSYYDANVYESGYQSSKALELYFDGETPEYEESYIIAMLPPMESLSGLQIEFNAMTYTQSTLQIGYMLGGQFVEVRSQALLSEFASAPYVVPITGNTGDAIQLAFRMADTNSSAIVFDNIVVDYIPSCPQVTALTATANGTNSIDLSWEVGSSETEWNVAYSTLGSNDTTVVTATTNPFTLTNLSPTTVYSIGVQARCSDSDSSSWTYTTAMTEAQFYHLPITSNFENDSVPWILENGTQTNHWMIGTLDNNNAIFITNDNANNTYTINSSSVVYAYMPVALD
ncbi:MAG: fibronectin type III domain-containing protein [Bacteroidales bacterium]|nr:fibronectin type III domain-containing protein [Bacteroidales bacterium]